MYEQYHRTVAPREQYPWYRTISLRHIEGWQRKDNSLNSQNDGHPPKNVSINGQVEGAGEGVVCRCNSGATITFLNGAINVTPMGITALGCTFGAAPLEEGCRCPAAIFSTRLTDVVPYAKQSAATEGPTPPSCPSRHRHAPRQ